MKSSLFPSPNPNYPTIWKPLPTKPIGTGGQTNLSNSFLLTPILMKSPLPLNEVNFRSSYFEKSELTNKEGSILSKVDYNNPMSLQFDQMMRQQSKSQLPNISISQNYFNSENGGTEQPHHFGTFLFGSNALSEIQLAKPAETTVSSKPLAFNESASSFKPMDYSLNGSTKKKETNLAKTVMKKRKSPLNHIMSVTNHFYFQFKNQHKKKEETAQDNETFIRKKRLREKSWNSKAKKLKKKDKRLDTYLLNQISIDNISIAKFPMIHLPAQDLSVQLLTRMVATESYFEIVDKYYSNVPGIEEEMINNKSFIKLFNKEKEKINDSLYLIEENVNETLPEALLKNYYNQIKETILSIQKNYIGKKKNALNDFECDKLKKLISSCNEITNIMTDFKKSGTRSKRPVKIKKKQQHYKTYLCEFCNKAYSNGQGLGGHISRIHHNLSEKYREKIRIRNNRVDRRQLIYDIKKELFARYGFNLDEYNSKADKKFIHGFMKEHKEEYYKIKKEVQKERKKSLALKIEEGNMQQLNSPGSSDESSINEEAVRTLETTRVETTYQQ